MSYEQRRISRQKRESRYKILITSIGIILLIILMYSLSSKDTKTILPLKDIFLEEIELQAVVIKDEKVFDLLDSNKDGIYKLEGERIPVGTTIGDSALIKDIESLRNELKQVENAIMYLEENDRTGVFINNKNELTNEYNDILVHLQQNIHHKNFEEIKGKKQTIDLINNKLIKLAPQNSLIGYDIEDLNKKKDRIIKDINNQDKSSVTIFSGIISFKVDKYENIYSPKGLRNYNYDDLVITEEKIDYKGEIKKTEKNNQFKIINNLEWYLAIKIDNRKDIGKYNIGDTLYIKYPLEDRELEIEGKIISINNSSNKSVIIVKFDKHLHDFYNSRFPKVKLIQEKKEALRIPNNTILDKKGEKGVYVKDFSGIVKFRPVKVISVIDGYTYIDKGDKNLLISIDTRKENVRTISIYDEVIVKPKKIKEGQILD